jgi:DNA (cytosine-5)-methyltransferase 1
MRFGSVCSGIEAASVAFGPLGWEAAWLAEVDVAASQVLAHHYGATAPRTPLPGTEKAISRLTWGDRIVNYGDMTTLPELMRAGGLEAPDVLCGGTPCQSFSVAGARRGLADARGNLALSFIQLADAIDERRAAEGKAPCIVIFENVPGLLSSKDNAFGCFLGALAGEVLPLVPSGRKWTNAGLVLGPERSIAWRVGDAQYHNLAQRRRRVFLVASAREGFDPGSVLLEFDGLRRDTPPRREAGEGSTHPLAPCPTSSGRGVERTGDPRGQDPVVAVERPDLAAEDARWPAQIASCLNAHFGDKWSLEDQHINQGAPLFVLSEVQAVALRGREGGATAELGGEQAYALRAAAGGGSDPYVLAPIPITAEDLSLPLGAKDRGNGLATAMAVRRLMPVECEALQGFPRNWTLVPVGKKLAADGPRYKQLGNSWAVPHARWVGSRVAAELDRLDRALTDAQSLI